MHEKIEEKLKVDITYAFTSRDLIKLTQAKKIQDVVRQANAFVHQVLKARKHAK